LLWYPQLGRQFASVGKDGYVRFWDCAGTEPVNSILLENKDFKTMKPSSNDCYNIGNGTILVAMEDGRVVSVDSKTKKVSTHIKLKEERITSLCKQSNTVICGTDSGALCISDIRSSKIIQRLQKNDATITRLLPLGKGLVLASCSDGGCYAIEPLAKEYKILGELVGPDCEAVNDMVITEGSKGDISVHTGSSDGVLRTYKLSQLSEE